jgi:ribosomal protein RSM22 (predicted rRNA methylase)
VPLPSQLKEAVEQEVARLQRANVARAAEQLTSDYKTGTFAGTLNSAEARAAYLVTRLPATFAACEQVLGEIARLKPDFAPESLLDLGAGPGTASWAAAQVWPGLREFALLEGNSDFAQLGRTLAKNSERLSRANWAIADLESTKELPSADVVVLSYAIGELTNASNVVSQAWNSAKRLFVVIEPGTPRNFAQMAQVRRGLISAGGHVVAPCPHDLECPMAATNDWCHFAARLERTSEHRRMKGGALGYEDEKFSYVAFAKRPWPKAQSRLVRHPRTHSGFIDLTLCVDDVLREQTVTRSQKEAFRAARRAKWGDEWRHVE